MNQLILFVSFVALLVATQIQAQNQYYGKQEASCIRNGGLCILGSECEEIVGAPGQLCPEQASKGFQCCYGLPKSETRCRMRGGECFKKNYCNKKLVYTKASDCSSDQECCILI